MRSCGVFSAKGTWSLASCLLLLCASGLAQSTNGRILGIVTDQTGAVLPGAKVTITDTERGISRTLTTNEVGEYVAPNLQPGLYKITGEASNFKKVERPAIRLEVAKDIRIDLQLTTGNASEVVTVTDEAPLVDMTSDTLGGTFTNKAINDLPLNGRDFQNLVTLRPGVQRYPGGGFLSISSNGVRPEDNNFIIDGTDDNDPYYGGTVINAEGVQGTPATHMPVDAIQEFNALENPPAEYGWKPGAIVNVGLKSGTNAIHGSTYYFRRDRNFDARNWFNTKPAPQKPLRLNQYGGSVGGPIKKDKLFYFLAFEGVGDLVGNSENLPAPATVSLGSPGDPAISIPDAITDLQLKGFTVNPLSNSLIPLFPTNNGTNPNGDPSSLSVGFPNRNHENDGLGKIDYHLSERHVITGRYFIGDSQQTERDISVLRAEWQSQAVTRAQASGANWTWTINNNLVNEAKFGFNRFWQTILTADANQDPNNYHLGGSVYQINTGVTTPINFGFPEIAISGFTSLGGNHGWPLETTPDQTFQFTDNVSWTHGKHTIRFGGEFRHGSTDNVRDRYGKSRIRFEGDGAFLGSTPLEDFLAGVPATGRIFVGNSERHVTIKSFGAFLQDDFRVTPRLTVNLGLRYDLTTPIKERNDLLGNFDPQKGLQQVGKDISSPYNTDANNFAPRVGVSWDPTGRGKTVIRAGGGITYEIPHMSIFIGQNGVDNASTAGLNVIPTGANGVGPGGTQGTGKIVAYSTDTPTLDWSTTGPIFNASVNCDPVAAAPCNILGVNRNLRTPYITTWNFNIQQELTRNTSLQLGYVGTRGTKLYSVYDINQVDPTKDDGGEQVGRPFNTQFPYLGVINQLGNGYKSNYHGLQASLTQRAWRGLSFVAGYTWAHALDQASLNRAAQPQDSLHPEKEYASSDIDIRHRFTLALSYELPGRKSFAQMLEGWQINSIVTIQSGLPWSVIDGFVNGNDVSLTGEFSDRWDFFGSPSDFKPSVAGIPFFLAGTPPSTDPLGPTDPAYAINNGACVNTAIANGLDSSMPFGCYTQGKAVMLPPIAGTFGAMGRNLFRGPGFRNMDFSIVKKWKFNERAGVQFRAEIFNVLNHPNFTNPYGVGGQLGNVDPSQGGFGSTSATTDVAAANPVIGSGGPRAIQLGIKFLF